jgi:hypothetical protein
LSARVVDEDANAEESPARIGTCFGVWTVRVVCGSGGNDVRR